MALMNKYDFIMYFTVKKANPNGDPLNFNRPRVDYNGFGEVTDVCLKRKLRNRMIDLGQNVFVQSDEKKSDNFSSLKARFESVDDIINAKRVSDIESIANETWLDVRSFGQVFSFNNLKGGKEKFTLGIRGPVSLHSAISEEVVDLITDSTCNNPMTCSKYKIDFGTYKLVGSINPQLSENTGFNDDDANIIKNALLTIFTNDASPAKPEGSMEVNKLYWFKHKSKLGDYPSSKIHNCVTLKVQDPKIKDFERYEIVEYIPESFSRIETNCLVELIG